MTVYPGLPFGWLFFWLCVSGFAIYAFGPPYWTLPTLTLGEAAAAAGIGLINSCGGLGGFVGPSVVGWLLTAGYGFPVAILFLSSCFFAAGVVTMTLRYRNLSRARAAEQGSAVA